MELEDYGDWITLSNFNRTKKVSCIGKIFTVDWALEVLYSFGQVKDDKQFEFEGANSGKTFEIKIARNGEVYTWKDAPVYYKDIFEKTLVKFNMLYNDKLEIL